MQPCNILIGCDQSYYEQWAINLVKSIQHFNPFVQCHVHIVNPDNYQKLPTAALFASGKKSRSQISLKDYNE